MNDKSRIPAEVREKILLAGELYEKARVAEGDVRQWMRRAGLTEDGFETRVEEMFIEGVCMGDGGGAHGFIDELEQIMEDIEYEVEADPPSA